MKFLKAIGIAILCNLSLSANAVVVNTLNGTTYEWYEVSNTVDLSRDSVESMLLDSSSTLFGYQYASRSLVEDLFLSYTSWDGLNGWHGNPNVVMGVSELFNDFGFTTSAGGGGTDYSLTTVDGYTVNYSDFQGIRGFYGDTTECGGSTNTCIGEAGLYFDAAGNPTMAWQRNDLGWSSAYNLPNITSNSRSSEITGSFLVREVNNDFISPSPVPVPAAAWLFGSALIGFVGISRRKKKA